MTEHIEYSSIEEWREAGEKIFGGDFYEWQFKCPSCGNVAKMKEFKKFKDKGATPDSAAKECIGRYTGGRNGPHKCDWAAYGFLNITNTSINNESGTKTCVFDFALQK